ncbi:MAG: integral rane sensor signal transduction histidine kinase [Anaerospora sp.]|nr:integral rane sensor signal transduction histidine kinase [Anaerospora sp.]
MIKFSLQPLIENCFTHGMGMAGQPLEIVITACQRDEQSFVIEVSDNGPGIDQATLERIRADLQQKDISQGGHSIGLVNVHRRISRIYEADYGLSVESTLGEGTVVTLRMPLSVAIQKGDAV